MQRAAIFDLNGVFIQSPPLSKRVEQDYGVPVAEFLPVLSSIMDQARQPGAQDIYEYWKQHLKQWEIPLSRQGFLDYWFTAEQENKPMIELASQLKNEGWLVFALSNNFRERAQYYDQHFQFLKDFDNVFYSWQTGNVKPDERCFTQILESYKLDPRQCFYFDDSDKNIVVAQRLGIHACKFIGVEQVKSILH